MLGDQKHWNRIGLASLETRNGGVQRWYLDQQWGWQFTLTCSSSQVQVLSARAPSSQTLGKSHFQCPHF